MFSQLNEWNAIFLIVHSYSVFRRLNCVLSAYVALPLPVSIGKVLYFLFTMLKRYDGRSWVINECNATGNPPELR